ncbi:MAG: type II toxin-antitoxin system VapC family toxin [Sphingomicrobium sp.]
MTIYCDTSLLVTALVGEVASERVLAWLAGKAGETLIISDWCVTEFSSALSLKLRNRRISPEQRAETLAAWASLRQTSLTTLPVQSEHFQAAATYCERSNVGLRASDALHLAVAAAHGCVIATLDAVQRKAAIELGIKVESV